MTAQWSTGAQRLFPPVVHRRKMFDQVVQMLTFKLNAMIVQVLHIATAWWV